MKIEFDNGTDWKEISRVLETMANFGYKIVCRGRTYSDGITYCSFECQKMELKK